jgi:hypothetical protein
MSEYDADPEAVYTGVSRGHDGNFAAAARDAENDLKAKRGGKLPDPPETFKADLYVTIGNPIHEFIVVLRPGSP